VIARIACGVVTLSDGGRGRAISAVPSSSDGDAGHGFPVCHGVQTLQMSGEGLAAGPEKIADGGENADEPLQSSRGSKALHHSFAAS